MVLGISKPSACTVRRAPSSKEEAVGQLACDPAPSPSGMTRTLHRSRSVIHKTMNASASACLAMSKAQLLEVVLVKLMESQHQDLSLPLQRVYHTSPIALRFVAPSKAYESMMYAQPTMMIELIMVVDSHRGEQLLASHERKPADLDVRPHWGRSTR
jgi:hypothetical protein